MVATSVAEEGLDIGKCNLVIRFAYVTNEISMTQSKGRARARESRYVLIVPEQEKWLAKKEEVNQSRDEMTKTAMVSIKAMSEDEYNVEIRELQRKEYIIRKSEEAGAKAESNKPKAYGVFHLHCRRCLKFACSSKDLRLAQSMHHLCLDNDLILEKRAELVKEEVQVFGKMGTYESIGKVLCFKCKQDWGQLCRIDKIVYPNLSIKNFFLKEDSTNKYVDPPPKKWKEVKKHFTVADLTDADKLARLEGSLGLDLGIIDSESGSELDSCEV